MRRWRSIVPMVLSTGAVVGIAFIYARVVPVNPTTIAMSYVVLVLLIATRWSLTVATVTSALATLCFNFVFLPPVGTLTIADPQNWISFVAFMATAIVASQLSGRARQRHIEATARQHDLEQLYALSRGLLLAADGTSTRARIARRISDAFDLPAVAVYDRDTDSVSWAGATVIPELETSLRSAVRQSATIEVGDRALVTPIQLGGAPIGSLAIVGRRLNDTVLHSVVNLSAIALERARGQEVAAHAEAARQSGELRATLLDAVAHEFKTPLTSSKVATSTLLSGTTASANDRELIVIVDEALDRLDALVSDAIQMLRIDARDFAIRRDRHSVADIVAMSLEGAASLEGRSIVIDVSPALQVDGDRALLSLALRQLINNALKYSPSASTIEVSGHDDGPTLHIGVRDPGPAIPERERERIFERFYRGTAGKHLSGSGMGLAIVRQIARAHGGDVGVISSAAGNTFILSMPKVSVPS